MTSNYYLSILKKSTANAVDGYVEKMILKHVLLTAIFGTSIFLIVGCAFAGLLDFSLFLSLAVLLISIQVIVGWLLSLLYKGWQLRFLGVLVLQFAIAIINLTFHVSPLLPPPRFLF